MQLPKVRTEILSVQMQFRVTAAEKKEYETLVASPREGAELLRWSFQQTLKALRERRQQEQATIAS